MLFEASSKIICPGVGAYAHDAILTVRLFASLEYDVYAVLRNGFYIVLFGKSGQRSEPIVNKLTCRHLVSHESCIPKP